jgi:hypothetical protein
MLAKHILPSGKMWMVEIFEPERGSDDSLLRTGLVHGVPILITMCTAVPLFELRA